MFAAADKKRPRVATTETLIGAGTVLSGDIVFSGGLRIDGEVKGNVRARDGQTGTLVIGELGRIEGDIDVARLIVNGLVAGRVDASEFVRLQSKARIACDLVYSLAEIHPGAVVHGQLVQRQDSVALAPTADPTTAQAAPEKP